MDKKKCQTVHALKRFKQRFNMVLTQAELFMIVNQIQDGQATFVSRRISKFKVKINGRNYSVVYDRLRKSIVTVLYK